MLKEKRAVRAQAQAREEERRLQREKEEAEKGGISSTALKTVQKIEITGEREPAVRRLGDVLMRLLCVLQDRFRIDCEVPTRR